MEINTKTIIGDIVAQNFNTAQIFHKHEIDFCCQGNRSIEKVCAERDIVSSELIDKLNDCLVQNKDEHDYSSWPLDQLADYIYEHHHKFVEEKVPLIKSYLRKTCEVHGSSHPELLIIESLFHTSANELIVHMKKEELILFPFFKMLAKAEATNTPVPSTQFTSVEHPINVMQSDHDDEGERFRQIAKLSNNYTPPENACNSYMVTFLELHQFEQDLHKHIHLENNVLFKKAIELNNKLN